MDYKNAGVDIEAGYKSVELMKQHIAKTMRPEVLGGIGGFSGAAHLPGMCAAIFPMPVIGIPMHTTSLGGRDSLYSIVQMPSGIPVATVAINGGANAGLLAAKILATSDPELLDRLKAYSQGLKEQVEAKDARLQEVGHREYK